MRKSFLKTLGYVACFAWSNMACAVGFGGINVTSSLGRSLEAEIELVAVDKADKSSLSAHLASPEAFKSAGIDYPYTLPKLKFQVQTRPNGEAFIKATSDQPVNEPFVSLLLELTWSSGRLLREYTFLLDPPGFVAEQPPATNVNPIEPVVASAVPAAGTVAESAPQAAAAIASAPIAATAASAVAAGEAKPVETKKLPPAKEAVSPTGELPARKQAQINSSSSPITVKEGDSLSKIANQTKSPDVTLERMLVALYHANAEEFDGHNMNRIRTGKILRLPEAGELAKVQQAEAVEEVRAQVEDWNAYRNKLASANSSTNGGHAKQEVAGTISTSIADKTPAAKDTAKEVLRLSRGEAEGDQTSAGGKAKSVEEKAIAKDDDAIAKAKALKEAQQRTALLEKNIKEMQRLVELKTQPASANSSAIPLIESSVVPASAATATSAVAAAKPKPQIAPPKVIPEPSVSDEIMEAVLADPVKSGGAAAALLGLAWVGLIAARRKKNGVSAAVEKPVVEPVQPPDDELSREEISPAPSADADEIDPIKEADLFLNFGRDVQAEEVLKEALITDPSNNQIKLKLLSIYDSRKDTKSFERYAVEIQQSRDEPAWEQAAAMGRELDPDNSLYGGGIDSVPVVSFKEQVVEPPLKEALDFDAPIPPALDFDLSEADAGRAAAGMNAEDLPEVKELNIDFDLSDDQDAVENKPKLELPALELPALDIDAGDDITASSEQAPPLNLEDLVFDAPSAAASPAPTTAAKLDTALEFTMDFPSEEKTAATASALAKDIGLSEISLDLDEPTAPATPQSNESKDEHWQEVATKLDLAKAYHEMGDQAGAREILEEVVRDGDATQRQTAETLLQQLS